MNIIRTIAFICCIFGLALVASAKSRDVVAIAQSFPDGGGYELKGSGVPEDVSFGSTTILGKGKSTYCSGFTFAVVMKAASERGLLKKKTLEQIRSFQKEWYGASKDSKETQCAYAVEKLGIGKQIEFKNARRGDFLQLWRTTKSGHSVVFLEWVKVGGSPIGVKYRSSQPATKGIGDNVEYFSNVTGHKGTVDPKRMYFCRLNAK
jgi:hypothetical protein